MTQTQKCVVSLNDKNVRFVEAMKATQEQLQVLQQHTWAQYLRAKYFANKSDIIDRSKCHPVQIQNEHSKANICISGGAVLGGLQILASSLYLLLKRVRVDKASLLQSSVLEPGDSIKNHIIQESEQACDERGLINNLEFFDHQNNKGGLNLKPGCNRVIRQHCHQQLLHLLCVISIILSFNNALPCSGFMYPLRYDNTGFIGYNYPHESPSLSTLNTATWNDPTRTHYKRNNDDPMLLMSTSRDSFTNDQSSQPQSSVSPTQNSWASMLTNAFGSQRDVLDNHIKKILVPRVSGTAGIVKVREYITSVLRANNYHIELDEFTDDTPVGKVKFSNIIASSNPNACRQLVLACHYDSKMMDGFLGAVDSAVPCAMLLKMSETFNKRFRATGQSSEDLKESLGLRFIFFDGEEAFEQWSATDSLYGSRHLAEKWSKQPAPNQCPVKNELARIELFVLLDLIGSSDTSFVMYNIPLKHHYNAMQKYEKQYLTDSGLSSSQVRRGITFKNKYLPLDFVEDDHVPFKKRGVPILSLLANPFPKVWHTVDDNYSAIDFSRTKQILYVLEQFVANYKKDAD